MAPDISSYEVYERPLSRQELLATGRLQSAEWQDEFMRMETMQPPHVQDPRYAEGPMPFPPFEGHPAQSSLMFDAQNSRTYPTTEQTYAHGFQQPHLSERRSLPPGRLTSMWGPESAQGHQPLCPPMAGRRHASLAAQPLGAQDGPFTTHPPGPPVDGYEPEAPGPDDPTGLLEDTQQFYGPVAVIGDWFLDPLTNRVSDGVKLVFEGAAALTDLYDPMMHGMQKAVSSVAEDLKTAGNFIGVTMEVDWCPACGGFIPVDQLYCPRCGGQRAGAPAAPCRDGGGASGQGPVPIGPLESSPLASRRFSQPEAPQPQYPTYSGLIAGGCPPLPRSGVSSPLASRTFSQPEAPQPQYPTYSGLIAGGCPPLSRSGVPDGSVKYARVLGEAEAGGTSGLGSPGWARYPGEGTAAPTWRTLPALSSMTPSAGLSSAFPDAATATAPRLAPGVQTKSTWDPEPQGGLRLAAVVA